MDPLGWGLDWRRRARRRTTPQRGVRQQRTGPIWEFPEIRGTLFWDPYNLIRNLLFRVLYWGPLFSETPI